MDNMFRKLDIATLKTLVTYRPNGNLQTLKRTEHSAGFRWRRAWFSGPHPPLPVLQTVD